MTQTIRDDRIDPDELDDFREDLRLSIDGFRPLVREEAREQEAGLLCRDDRMYFTLEYAAGVPLEDLVGAADEWGEDILASLDARGPLVDASGAIPELDDRDVLRSAIELLFVATSLGRAEIASRVLAHSAVSTVPCRTLDVLAATHGVDRPVSESDVFAGAYDPWLAVASAHADHRQAAFEQCVRGWRAHMEKERLIEPISEFHTGAWAFEAVVLARVFGLDDRAVRDVPEYPADLADFSESAGVVRLDDDVTLPGPWKKPVPQKVLEPEVLRAPVAVSGEPTLADIAALLSPVGSDVLAAADGEPLLNAAVDAGTVVTVDARALEPAEVGELLRLACRSLGLPAPSAGPTQVATEPAEALPQLDAWLEPVGVRLLGPATDTDDLVFFPVLAVDYETFRGHTVAGLRLRTMEQVAADET